jgi:hypothetical protein
MAKLFDKTTVCDGQSYALVDGIHIRVYDKKEAMAILGISHPAQITQLITHSKLGSVGYVPVNESSGTTKLLLNADSVDAFKLEVRHHNASGVQRFEIAISCADLDEAINRLFKHIIDENELEPLLNALQHAKNLTARNSEYMKDRKRRKAAKDDVMPNGKLHLEG